MFFLVDIKRYTPPFEQLVPAVNNNGTSHMEKELLVSVLGGYTSYSI